MGKGLLSVFLILLLVSGCSFSDSQPPNSPSPQVSVEQPQQHEPDPSPEPAKEEPKEEPKADPQLQPGTENLASKKYSWWFSRGTNHKPSTIDPAIAALLKKYDGIWLGSPSRKVIYLTFDEGYEQGYTASILDTLKANQVKAAFFITKDYLDRNPQLVKRMVAEGHIVGNHTVTHPSLPSFSNNGVVQELKGLEDAYYQLTGQTMVYLRPPMGEYSERVLSVARQMGYRSVFWSFAYRDWETDKQKGADYAFKTVMDQLHPGEVMLLHAVSKDNTEALEHILKEAKAQGYLFETLDRL